MRNEELRINISNLIVNFNYLLNIRYRELFSVDSIVVVLRRFGAWGS